MEEELEEAAKEGVEGGSRMVLDLPPEGSILWMKTFSFSQPIIFSSFSISVLLLE